MKLMDKITGKLYDSVFKKRCDIRPGIKYLNASFFNGLNKEDYSFKNDNNFILKGGFYYYNDYIKDTLVLFNHGIGGGHEAYMKEIEYLARNGFKVLAMDYQGCIASEGDGMEGISRPLLDMAKLVSILKNEYQNIYVVGHSWGGYVTQGVCALNKEVKKAVSIAGLHSVKSMFEGILKFPLNIFKISANRLEYDRYGEVSLLNASESFNREDLKVLVIQSKDDAILNPKYNIELIKQNCTNKNVEFMDVDNKNHNPTYTVEAVNLLSSYLKKLNHLHNKEKIKKLESEADFDKMSELDPLVMDKIVEFLKN